MPGTLPSDATHCSSVVFMTSRSVPKIFSTTWPRTPLTASSTLSLIGPEKLKVTPGISVSDARIASDRRSFVQPGRHLLPRRDVHERLAHVDALVVGAVLRAPLLAQRLEHFGKGEQPPTDFLQDRPPAIERDARRHLDEDHDVALVELRQKLAAESRADEPRHEDQAGDAGDTTSAAPVEQPPSSRA